MDMDVDMEVPNSVSIFLICRVHHHPPPIPFWNGQTLTHPIISLSAFTPNANNRAAPITRLRMNTFPNSIMAFRDTANTIQ